MADNIDPLLLRAMRGIMNQSTNTRGAGLVDNPALMRSLQSNQPRVMGGFSPARPGAGFMPPRPFDNVAQGEIAEGELGTIPGINKPLPGGNIDPTKADRTPWMNANDKQNILKSRLDNMRAVERDDDWKYQMALAEQRDKFKSQQPIDTPAFKPPATITPLGPDIVPRQPLNLKQIHSAAKKIESTGDKDTASQIKQYNFKTEKFRDQIKDYQLAHSDLNAWAEKNAVPDVERGLEDMDKLNDFLRSSKQPTIHFGEYRELKKYELQEKMRRQGPDSFYNELKSNLTSMHKDLDRIHKLIESNQE